MINKGKISLFMAVLFLIVIFSGCVNRTPSQTSTPTETSESTPVPTQVTPVPTTITPSPIATPYVQPAIKMIFYPSSPDGDTNITIRWEVSGGTPGEINSTAVYWGYKSGNASTAEYPKVSVIQTGKTPQGFGAAIKTPAGGSIFFRVHAIVDGTDIYSPEYQITIAAPTGGGSGGY